MVNDTPVAPVTPEELEAQYLDDKAFEPQEFFTLAELVELNTIFLSDDRLKAMRVDITTPEFAAAFPNGVMALEMALKGIDVDFAYAEDHIRRIQIPMVNTSGNRYGQPKGERSQLHITSAAFVQVAKIKPFGTENREKLTGLKYRWGQHIGKGDFDGEERTWRWDIPRLILPADFVFTGEVRVQQGNVPGGVDTGVSNEMSEEEAVGPILSLIVGQPVEANVDLCDKVLQIPGMPTRWVNGAIDRTLLKQLSEEGYIGQAKGLITAAS